MSAMKIGHGSASHARNRRRAKIVRAARRSVYVDGEAVEIAGGDAWYPAVYVVQPPDALAKPARGFHIAREPCGKYTVVSAARLRRPQ